MLFYNNDKKPRKRSFYSFSKNYPGIRGYSYDIGESRARRKKEKRNRILFAVGLVVLFAVVFITSSVFIKLSKRPLDNNSAMAAQEYDGKLRALYMPEDALTGGIAFDLFETKLSQQKANAVVVDFKKKNGDINFVIEDRTANDIGACLNAYSGAADTVKKLRNDGYKIIVRIYCYEDVKAASMLQGAAVTENDGTTVWLDDSAQNDGNPWLNPYSSMAQDYLLGIIAQGVNIGADAVMLSSVTFPESNRVDKAYFAGEAQSVESRNSVIHSFVEKAAEICGDVPVMVYMNADNALNGSVSLFGGGMFDSGALFNAVDFRQETLSDGFPLGDSVYTKDAVSENALIQTAVPTLNLKLEENFTTKAIVPIIDDNAYVSTLENLGINNYILIEKENT